MTLNNGGDFNTKEKVMNSFLRGFFSLFDWMVPKTMEESLNDLDDSMQRLYDRMGWGKYTTIDLKRQEYVPIVSQSTFLDEMIKLVPSGNFQPYAYYNEEIDSIEVYFKDAMYYTQPLNNNIELYLCHDTNEIIGAKILRVKSLLNKRRK